MSALAVPYNIQNYAAALAEGLSRGDNVHIRICGGQVTEDAFFIYFTNRIIDGIVEGIVVKMKGVHGERRECFLWGDIVELWSLEEKPNIYHSDVPEVAEKLKQLKLAVQKCVEGNNGPGVLFLLDQVPEVKKAERFFKEAREILSSILL